jgi:diamine N-acetyltransferase
MMTIVRRAAAGDESDLADLNAFVQDLHVANNPSYFKRAVPDEVRAWFRDQMRTSTVRIWIAEMNGRAVGYAVVLLHERPENPFCHARRWFEVDQIAVRPQDHRMGIARTLMNHVLEAARAEGVRDVELTTWSFNSDAQRAFARLGFTPKQTRLGRDAGQVDSCRSSSS